MGYFFKTIGGKLFRLPIQKAVKDGDEHSQPCDNCGLGKRASRTRLGNTIKYRWCNACLREAKVGPYLPMRDFDTMKRRTPSWAWWKR